MNKSLHTDRSEVLHCLCVMHREMVLGGEFRYILNDLVVTDLLLWIQSVPEQVLKKVAEELQEIKVSEKV